VGAQDGAGSEQRTFRVYVIELRPEVLEKRRVADENADRREDKPCVYVGQTAKSPEERFAQHLAGKRSSRIVREYGVQLKPRLYRNVGPFGTRAEAEAAEKRLAEKLRRRGYAVWSR
jgi:predicted GIY-YIG superfamily endonuclease